ncbi:hypothetical protein QQF64_023882 [Cirrhinus molitorella]|uniref:Uncharacterized protein n=1 Tax=Cirrhinus molitorella TaxID=172907 RepID=A0ABR3NJW7_9TELE
MVFVKEEIEENMSEAEPWRIKYEEPETWKIKQEEQKEFEESQLDSAAQRIGELEAKVGELEDHLSDLSASKLHINRYCATDEEFRFYTRFLSEKLFWTILSLQVSILEQSLEEE